MKNPSYLPWNIVVSVLSVPMLMVTSFAEEPVSKTQIRATIEKSLPYIERRGEWWIEKKKCMSCHRTSFMAWSHSEAAKAGVEVDSEKVNRWIDWSHRNLFEPFPLEDQKYPGEKTIERNLSGAAQMLLLASGRESSSKQREYQSKIVATLIKGQEENGSWLPRGQLPYQKRELDETTQVITMWNAYGLFLSAQNSKDTSETKATITKANQFLINGQDGLSTEWLALKALTSQTSGEISSRNQALKKLLGLQNKDGGWRWKEGEKNSDVLATAQVLFVLQEIERLDSGFQNDSAVAKAVDESKGRAIGYLVQTQPTDGRWKVNGTKEKHSDKVQETASYWGSCWAVIALSRSLSDGSTTPRRKSPQRMMVDSEIR